MAETMKNRAKGGWKRPLAGALVLLALVAFYHEGATEHARVVNVSRVRADQSGYLWDAVAIYDGRHGGPKILIGERNRMPAYPWLLSWLYDPAMSPEEFFEIAKKWNIRLSLLLLGALAIVVRRYLPPLPAANLILVVGFGYFVFKAGYAQVELLYYFLFFLTFLACCRLLESRRAGETLGLAILAGALAAITHLTKAAVLPFVAIFLAVYAARALVRLARAARGGAPSPAARRPLAAQGVALALFAVCFLGILSPYLVNSKRVFGRYFYNVNTTFYVWYDDWPAASRGTYSHGDGEGWPRLPRHQIPTMRTYLRDHTAAQIAGRVADGLREMVTVSYIRLWYFKYVALYVAFALVLVARARPAFLDVIRAHPALFVFLLLYAAGYLLAVAFYKPISGTTLRMLLPHVAPLLFVLSRFFARVPFRDLQWRVAGVSVHATHFHLLVLATIGLDLVFTIWPRLMSEFAGY